MIEPYARAAFAAGYAEAGEDALPVAGSATVDLQHAMAFAEMHLEHPEILEVVRRIGRAKAIAVAVGRRRDALETRWRGKLRKVLRQLAPMSAPTIVDAVTGTRRPTDHMEAAVRRDDMDAARAAAERALQSFADTDVYREWQELTRQAWREGQAEGTAEGRAWLADARAEVIPDFDIEFRHAMDALRALPDTWSDLDTWMGEQTHGLAYEMGGRLAQAIEDGADREALLGIVADTMGGEDNGADLMLDHAVTTAANEGSLALYVSEGLEYVDVLISPDACDECSPLPDGNPYPIGATPDIPLHPRCRCGFTPHLTLAL